jgi:hypothetical protein
MSAERTRLEESERREKHWKRWGPYVAERSWGNPREDYSDDGSAWDYFTHEISRSRAYRWTEDGIAGICDNHQRLCFALAFWNGQDRMLKERLFGLGGPQGNHGEDVKEYYYYLDSTPTHSYMKYLYKYPQAAYPYEELVAANRDRSRQEGEFELIDTGVLKEDRYFDIFIEYAKADVNDILVRITAVNRGPAAAPLHILPTLWFRNTWSWEKGSPKPNVKKLDDCHLEAHEASLGGMRLWCDPNGFDGPAPFLFTENETNTELLFATKGPSPFYKDAFHERIVEGRKEAVNPEASGTKACAWYQTSIGPGESKTIRLRLHPGGETLLEDFDTAFQARSAEANDFYSFAPHLSEDGRNVQRQAFAGLLWSKQFYHYVVEDWLKGDPAYPPPPIQRLQGRNKAWRHLYNDDVLSMPDKWEYPWFAAWDLAFHMIPFALVDPDYAKDQLSLLLREWYMAPNGQLPAYEWEFSDVNPPVHAWSCWRVFQIDRKLRGTPDYVFLEACFHKLLMNFTWWVNRKDSQGNNIFEGGFLGLDNIGVFDRSKPLPTGGTIEQADGTAWMAWYSLIMMKIAMALAPHDTSYEDIASKFFEHFLYIASAINGPAGLWDEGDGFYYDSLLLPNGSQSAMRVRSLVGLLPLLACGVLEESDVDRLPGFKKRMQWFLDHRPDLCVNIECIPGQGEQSRRLLSIVHRDKLVQLLQKMLDENEFLSPHGIRSVSRFHKDHPFVFPVNGHSYRVDYEPAESTSGMFGGNSNWRGPVWMPVNFLLMEALQRYGFYYGDDLKVEFPTGSGNHMNLEEVAKALSRRLSRIFLRDSSGRRAVFGDTEKFQTDPNFRDYVPFFEYFHGDTGRGLGASHQTGWTALVAKLLQQSGE